MIGDFLVLAASLVIALGIMYVHRPKDIPQNEAVALRLAAIRKTVPHEHRADLDRFTGPFRDVCVDCGTIVPGLARYQRIRSGLEGGLNAEGDRP